MADRQQATPVITCARGNILLYIVVLFVLVSLFFFYYFNGSGILANNKTTEFATRLDITKNDKDFDGRSVDHKIPSKPQCTHELFRDFYKTNKHFPGDGTWTTGQETFQPSYCRLEYNMDATKLEECFNRQQTSSILIVGDSNGKRYFEALLRKFEKASLTNCTTVSVENRTEGKYTPDRKFLTFNMNTSLATGVVVKRMACGTCTGSSYMCTLGTYPRFHVNLGSFPMLLFSDKSLQVRDGEKKLVIKSSQEFLFKLFLKNRYPDLILMFVPMHHIKTQDVMTFINNIRTVRQLIKDYVPKSTRVFFIPSHGEFESVRTAKPFKNRRYGGLLANQKIHALNLVLFDELYNDLVTGNNTFGFINLWDVGKSRVDLCVDGVHMKSSWYDMVIEMFLEIFCNGL